MRVTAIGGIPASGKTSLMFRVIDRLSERAMPIYFKEGLVQGYDYPALSTVILGNYYDASDKFAGTDRMSMAAQPKVLEWLAHPRVCDTHVLYEGDRLFNKSFFEALTRMNIPFEIYALMVAPEVAASRCIARGSDQNTTFLKGRVTKITNVVKSFDVHVLPNDTIEEQQKNVDRILGVETIGNVRVHKVRE